jgi:hypothetical protein
MCSFSLLLYLFIYFCNKFNTRRLRKNEVVPKQVVLNLTNGATEIYKRTPNFFVNHKELQSLKKDHDQLPKYIKNLGGCRKSL